MPRRAGGCLRIDATETSTLHRSRKPRLAGHFSSPHSHATPIGHNEHDASPSALEPQAHIGQGEEGAGRKPHPILHSTRSPIDSTLKLLSRPTVTLTVRPMSDVRVCYGSHPVSAVAEAACQHVRLSSATAGPSTGPGVPRSRQNLVVLELVANWRAPQRAHCHWVLSAGVIFDVLAFYRDLCVHHHTPCSRPL